MGLSFILFLVFTVSSHFVVTEFYNEERNFTSRISEDSTDLPVCLSENISINEPNISTSSRTRLYYMYSLIQLLFSPKLPVVLTNSSDVQNVAEETATKVELSNVSQLIHLFKSKYPTELWSTNGLFTEDYLLTINKHWLKYDPPSPVSHYVLAALYVLIFVIGVFGNSLVISMFLRCKSLRTPANILIMNLAVSDFFMIFKTPIFIYNSILRGPALGNIGCQIYGFVGGLTGTVSITTLAAIAVDRYFVITYPLNPLRSTTRRRAKFCVFFVWCYGFVFSSLPLFGINKYVAEGYLTSCSFDYLSESYHDRLFIFIFFIAAWCVPFSIISFCYINICRVVRRANNMKASGQESARHYKENEKRKKELKLGMVVIGVVTMWFVSWTPYAIVALMGIFGRHHIINPLLTMVPALFCKTTSCVDPFVYAVCHPRFRFELKSAFPCLMSRDRQVMAHAAISFRTATINNTVVCQSVEKNVTTYHVQNALINTEKAIESDSGEEEEIIMLAMETTVVARTETSNAQLKPLHSPEEDSLSTSDSEDITKSSLSSIYNPKEHENDNFVRTSISMFTRSSQDQEPRSGKKLSDQRNIRSSLPLLGKTTVENKAKSCKSSKSSHNSPLARTVITRSSFQVKSKVKQIREDFLREHDSI